MSKFRILAFLLISLLAGFACVPSPRYRSSDAPPPTYPSRKNKSATSQPREYSSRDWQKYTETGIASFTADEQEGQLTASGEIYHMRDLVAAHRYLPFGTIVRVTNLENGKSVNVKINDRGPFVKGRIIDLSFEAAKKLGFIQQGTARVKVEVIRLPRR